MMHGREHPEIRLTNAQAAINALAEAGIVSAENAARLSEALLFLRQLINALRMVHGNSKDLTVPPEESDEFSSLTRRLNYGNEPARPPRRPDPSSRVGAPIERPPAGVKRQISRGCRYDSLAPIAFRRHATAQKHALLRLVWVGIVSMMLLAACGAPTPTPEPVSIRFVLPAADVDATKGLVEQFRKANPNVQVELVGRRWDPLTGINASGAACCSRLNSLSMSCAAVARW